MRRLAAGMLVLATSLALVTPTAEAKTVNVTVDDRGDGADAKVGDGTCATSSGDCTFRAAVMEASKNGGAITLPKGTYAIGSPMTVTRAVEITGAGAETTTIDLSDDGSAFVVSSGALTLIDLTVTGSRLGGRGGSVVDATESAIRLQGVVMTANVADGDGGALAVGGGSLSVTSSTFQENAGNNGGAISADDAEVTISASTFTENGGTGSGGALFVTRPRRLLVEDSTFTGNDAQGSGGAVFVDLGTAEPVDLVITGSTFEGNFSTNGGGGLFVGWARRLFVESSTFEDNRAAFGGAIGAEEAELVVESTTFTGNRAEPGKGGAITAGGPLTVSRSTFTANTAAGGGGTLAVPDDSEPTAGGNRFEENVADEGESDVSGAELAAFTGSVPKRLVPRSLAAVGAGRGDGGDDEPPVFLIAGATVAIAVIAAAGLRLRRRS